MIHRQKTLFLATKAQAMRQLLIAIVCVSLISLLGCKDPNKSAKKKDSTKSKTGIFNKKTSDIGEFDPNAGAKVSDGKMKEPSALNPMGALNAYGPIIEKLSKQHIDRALQFFHAEKGRYPKDYDEFMNKVIKQNSIKLPVLPGHAKYQYDVENHKLVVVKAEKEDEGDK